MSTKETFTWKVTGVTDGFTIENIEIEPSEDLDPPSYLPMQPREAPRVPDLCPDDMGYARVDMLKEVQQGIPHNPETCRDPACDCYPF